MTSVCNALGIRSAAALALGLLLASSAHATSISLSQVSSDETDAAVLDATYDFTISGASELTLTVSNTTTSPFEFDLDEIYFNGSSDVTGLSLASASDGASWTLQTAQDANGFGTYDFSIVGSSIETGTSVVFVLDITGAGPYDMADFVESGGDCSVVSSTDPGDCETFSSLPPGDLIAQVAGKFVGGPGDDSAFGASNGPGQPPVGVPEPGSLALLFGATALVAAWRRSA